MAERHSSAVQQVSGVGQQTVEDVRLTQSAMWTPTGLITSRSGFVPSGTATAPGSVLATTPTPNGFVHVQPFREVLQSGRGGGVYVRCLDAIKDINILSTSADPSNARRDLIIAQQSDAYFSDANSDMVVKQVVGTPSGSPVDPTVTGSADYLLLARVTVPAGATSITQGNITQLATQLTVATGGVLPVADATERAAIANPYDGMMIFRRDKGWVEIYYSGAWRVGQPGASGCRYTNPSTNQNFLSGQLNKFSYPTAVKTTPGIVASGTNNTDFTVQTGWDGWWMIDAGGRLGNTSVSAYFTIRKGTTEIKGHNPQAAQTFHVASVSVLTYLAAGDSINFACGPSSNITTAPADEVQSFAMKYHGQ